MASVIAIVSEVFGRCIGEVNASIEIENRDVWLCYGWNYLGFVLAGKAAQYLWRGWEMVPGIGCYWGLIEGG